MAARPTASNVTISLGLISFHVDLHSAVQSKQARAAGASTILTCPTCHEGGEHSPLKQRYFCEQGHGPFAKGDAVTALSVDSGIMAAPADKVAAATVVEGDRTAIELTVHPADEVETCTISTGNVYRLKPRDNEAQYALMLELVRNSSVAFVGEYTNKGATLLYRIVARGDLLVMAELVRPDRVTGPFEVSAVKVDERLLETGKALVLSLTEPFEAAAWADRRKARLNDLAAKLKALEPVSPADSSAADTAANLLELLRRSVDAAA
jgi:non-homologous end joining protein Ku